MKIRAAVSRKDTRSPELADVELKEIRNCDVLVRIVACGVCRTDVDAHLGTIRVPKPIVLGHEGAGVVEAIGADVTTLKQGDHVVLSGSSCGQCRNCKRDLPTYCRDAARRNFGGLRSDGSTYITANGSRVFGSFFGQSSFAQYAIAEERTAVKVPKDLALSLLAPLGCGVTTGAGAVFNALAPSSNDSIAIFGVGAVGLSAVMAANVLGLRRIIAIDQWAERLAVARELGATDAFNASETDIENDIRKLCPDGVDFALNTTSSAALMTTAVQCLAMRGVAGFVSAPHETWMAPLVTLLGGGRTLRAVLGGDASPHRLIGALIEFYRRGQFPIDRLIKFYSFSQIAEAFDALSSGRAIKPVLLS